MTDNARDLDERTGTTPGTRWRVWTLPRQDGVALLLYLTTPSFDPQVIATIEETAALAGMSITREPEDEF